ncbi:MAG TPA: HD domain-containing phosphohydrolase [Anaeromyxobacter sp.]|nr:HD domain-containing phosphohydrolase [Anaeromyxobacter sp.]
MRRTLLLLVLLSAAAPTALAAVLLVGKGGFDAHAVAAVAGSLALAALLAALVARGVTRPIAECVAGALDIARGRFGRQVSVSTRNEIGDLAYTFNHMSRELAAYDGENQRLIRELERGYLDTIRSLAAAVDAKDPYTRGHSERVAALSVEIGRELRLSEPSLKALEYGGVLHDIGKIGIPDAILAKRGTLNTDEMALVRDHPAIGADIVGGIAFLKDALPCILFHHERWDGTGYPQGIAGDAIPLLARIVNIADTFDACTSRRPYQEPIPTDVVVAILDALRGTQTDPAVHDALLGVLRRTGALQGDSAA